MNHSVQYNVHVLVYSTMYMACIQYNVHGLVYSTMYMALYTVQCTLALCTNLKEFCRLLQDANHTVGCSLEIGQIEQIQINIQQTPLLLVVNIL